MHYRTNSWITTLAATPNAQDYCREERSSSGSSIQYARDNLVLACYALRSPVTSARFEEALSVIGINERSALLLLPSSFTLFAGGRETKATASGESAGGHDDYTEKDCRTGFETKTTLEVSPDIKLKGAERRYDDV